MSKTEFGGHSLTLLTVKRLDDMDKFLIVLISENTLWHFISVVHFELISGGI